MFLADALPRVTLGGREGDVVGNSSWERGDKVLT